VGDPNAFKEKNGSMNITPREVKEGQESIQRVIKELGETQSTGALGKSMFIAKNRPRDLVLSEYQEQRGKIGKKA